MIDFCHPSLYSHHKALVIILTQCESESNLFPVVATSDLSVPRSPIFASSPIELTTGSSYSLLINPGFDSLTI